MSWADELQQASFRGVEFECQTLDDEVSRRIAVHEYPGRDGADLEDLGRKPITTRIRAVFTGPTYKTDLGKLLRAIDQGEKGTFVHSILGTWPARVQRGSVQHSFEAYDMASVELEVMEDQTDRPFPDVVSVSTVESEAEADVQALGPYVIEVPETTGFIDAALGFIAAARSKVNQLTNMVDRVRNKANAVIAAAKKLGDVKSWPIVVAVKKALATVRRLAKAVRDLKPGTILHRTKTPMSLSLLAHTLYGKGSRADEIRRMNRLRNPLLIPAGTELKVYAR